MITEPPIAPVFLATSTSPVPAATPTPASLTPLEHLRRLGPRFAARAAEHDETDRFVAENYAELKTAGLFRALVPAELGGGGLSHSAMADLLAELATHCGSTALALAMHQHLVAANVWKFRRGQGAEAMLRNVAANQPVLVSTGARDWLESGGEMRRDGANFVVTATKAFASQSALGDILVTSAPFCDPEQGWQVLHFPVSLRAAGVSVLGDWKALGMRATGSHTVRLDRVVIPESAVVLRRPRGKFHPFWNVVLAAAMPLIMGVYVGIARQAAKIATRHAATRGRRKPHAGIALGALHNELVTAEVMWRDMVRLAGDLDFAPSDDLGCAMLHRKTVVARACIAAVTQAMELAGGEAFRRDFGLERLFRDVQGARLHPLAEWDQQQFCGERLLAAAAAETTAS